MLDFEFSWPYSSCYTEQDLRYLASKSKSLFFNKDRFLKNSGWMGIWESRGKQLADAIEERYFVDRKPGYLSSAGSNLGDRNDEPFFLRRGDDVCFTIPAIFAGRDMHKRSEAIRNGCDANCFVCGIEIKDRDPKWSNSLDTGILLDFQCERFEMLCNDCYKKWIEYKKGDLFIIWEECHWRVENRYAWIEDQISLTKFILYQNMSPTTTKDQ